MSLILPLVMLVGCPGSDPDPECDTASVFHEDLDGDGYGGKPANSCDPPEVAVANGDDCNDEDAGVNPSAVECRDGIDQDCDGTVDEEAIEPTTWYPDQDGDGVGTDLDAVSSCDTLSGFSTVAGDCDDQDAQRQDADELYPGSVSSWDLGEVCDPCTVGIDGDLSLSGSDPMDFFLLDCVEQVTGDLWVSIGHITSLEGLESLTAVGGDFTLRGGSGETVLDDLTGLDGLESVGGELSITHSDLLLALDGLDSLANLEGGLRIFDANSLVDLSGLGALASIGGDLRLELNSGLQSLEGLDGLQVLQGSLLLDRLPALSEVRLPEELTSIGGWLQIDGHTSESWCLESLSGLSHLESVGESVIIEDVDCLGDVIGLGALVTANAFQVRDLADLTSLEGLDSLTTLPGGFYVLENPQLSSVEVPLLASIGIGINLYRNTVLTTVDLPSLVTLDGKLEVEDNPKLEDLDAFSGISALSDLLVLEENESLVSIQGLAGIESIGGDLRIEECPGITSLDAFSALTSLTGHLWLEDLDGLTTLDGLEGISTVIEELFMFYNSTLVDVTALHGLPGVERGVSIHDNYLLTNAAAEALVEAIGEENIGGTVRIEGNN